MNRGVVALVTGGASGLGLATVRHVLKTGGKAIIADLPGSQGSSIAKEMSENCRLFHLPEHSLYIPGLRVVSFFLIDFIYITSK